MLCDATVFMSITVTSYHRNIVAGSCGGLDMAYLTATDLWNTLYLHQGESFQTSGRGKKVGVSFTYRIPMSKRDRSTPSGEMFIESIAGSRSADTQWSSKSITRATVELAYRNALDEQDKAGFISGPKKLGTFGASYLYAVFARLGLIRGRDAVDNSCRGGAEADAHRGTDDHTHTQLSIFTEEDRNRMDEQMEDGNKMDEERVDGQENVEEQDGGKKRVRRSSEQLRADKIAVLEEKISKKEAQLAALKEELAELKRPPQLSEKEKQALFRSKIDEGSLTEEEAYQLGWKG